MVVSDSINLLIVIVLIAATAFFVAAEFAMVKIRESKIQQLINEGNASANKAMHVINNLDGYLSACQLGITLTALGLGWIGEPTVAGLVEPLLTSLGLGKQAVGIVSFLIGFSTISFLHVVVGELAPKSLAIQRAEGVALFVSGPLIWFHKIMYPAIWLLNGAANTLIRWVGLRNIGEHQGIHSEEEIRMLLLQSHEGGEINQSELELTSNIFEMNEKIAVDIMIPRTSMVCMFDDLPIEKNFEIIAQEQFARYPVCLEDKDHIIGYIHTKDLLTICLRNEKITSIKQFYREPLFIYEFTPAVEILQQMQKQRKQLAIVLDEYGGTAGVVALEDVLEEIVGEIEDEYDIDDVPPVFELGAGHYSIDARESIIDVQQILNITMETENIHTLGGWFINQYRGKLEKDAEILHEGYRFKVVEIEGNSIFRFEVKAEQTDEVAPIL
ncbi:MULTISPECIES: hemolysin family protein [Sporomusa]|uniref:hemolysin family protein n=1 Tax=Sporomusa TaxID=2375 RepID=UPI002B7DB8C7|nr:hemolysin family protein [Sporomusa sphaeroides]HML34700.1 hemolysin family protein [Sporomusa sphaeroides]